MSLVGAHGPRPASGEATDARRQRQLRAVLDRSSPHRVRTSALFHWLTFLDPLSWLLSVLFALVSPLPLRSTARQCTHDGESEREYVGVCS